MDVFQSFSQLHYFFLFLCEQPHSIVMHLTALMGNSALASVRLTAFICSLMIRVDVRKASFRVPLIGMICVARPCWLYSAIDYFLSLRVGLEESASRWIGVQISALRFKIEDVGRVIHYVCNNSL